MIISASRRTDIPAFYSDWLIKRLREGFADVPNPRNPKSLRRVDLTPENVDCIVFWTKNPAPMEDKVSILESMGYNFYFTFTITPYDTKIEACVPPKDRLTEVFKRLSKAVGKARIDWRYDPILLDGFFDKEYHFEKFGWLCDKLHDYTTRCIISFADEYRHLKNIISEPDEEIIADVARGLSDIAKGYKLPLFACAEPHDLSDCGIKRASCIDQEKIERITGRIIKAKLDKGQRPACGCVESADIGMYNTCAHGCVYCYAATSKKTLEKNLRFHDPNSSMLSGNSQI